MQDVEEVAKRAAELAVEGSLKESEARMQRYLGTLKEDTDHKLEAITEYVKDIPNIKERVGVLEEEVSEIKKMGAVTFEAVGDMAVDVEMIKESVKHHEERLSRIEV